MRTFSEEEARAVFAQAARDAPADDLGSERLTLDELVEIGRAAGLDPERVALAAAALGAPAPRAQSLLGMPTEVRRTRVLSGPLSDAAWEQSVDAMRTLFGGPGRASQVGRGREWLSPSKMGRNDEYAVHLAARPLTGGGTEIVVEKFGMKEYAWSTLLGTVASLLIAVGFGLASPGEGSGDPANMVPIIFFASSVLLFVALGFGVRAWARGLDRRFEAALDRIDLIARQEAATLERLAAPAAARRRGAPRPQPSGRRSVCRASCHPHAHPMTDDRFSEDEIRQVFERAAAEVERARSRAPEGLTVDEMAEVGEASGIPRAFVEAAAWQVRLGAPEASVGTFGPVPTSVRRSVRLLEPPSEALWQRLVADARRTFDATGRTGGPGEERTWRNGNLRMTLEPDGDGSRLTLRTDKEQRLRALATIGIIQLFAAVMVLVMASSAGDPLPWGVAAILALLATALLGSAWRGQRRWAEARAGQMETLTDAAATITPAPAFEAPERSEAPAGRIDPRLLDADLDADLHTPTHSRRTRS